MLGPDPRSSIRSIRVPERKLNAYLLDPTHVRGKAGFFLAQGYTARTLLLDLTALFTAGNVAAVRLWEPWGWTLDIRGHCSAPNGRLVTIRTGWGVRRDEPAVANFITAFPD